MNSKNKIEPYVIGNNCLIRTVTMIYTGKLEQVYDQELVISSAAWIPETKRWANSLTDGIFEEVEPYPKDIKVIIGRGSILDVTFVKWELPQTQK